MDRQFNKSPAPLHTIKHLHSRTFILNHVRSGPVYIPEWRAQEVSLQGKKHFTLKWDFLCSPLRNVNRSWPDMVQDEDFRVEAFYSVFRSPESWRTDISLAFGLPEVCKYWSSPGVWILKFYWKLPTMQDAFENNRSMFSFSFGRTMLVYHKRFPLSMPLWSPCIHPSCIAVLT